MNNIEQKFSVELQTLFSYVTDILNVEHPTKKIGVEYLIVAILDSKKTHAYALLNNCLLSSNINELRNIYVDYISNNSQPQFYRNNDNSVQFDENMQMICNKMKFEYDMLNSTQVGSEHLLLAILNPNNNLNEIINVFNNVGVDYNFLFEKCSETNGTENKNKDKKTKPSGLLQIKGTANANSLNNQQNKYPFIDQYTINLNQLAKKGELDELIGRDKEIETIVKVLARRKKNNVILVGKSGVGKSQIVYGIANLINQNKVPELLQGKEIVMINITALVSGTHFRGMFEERVNGLFEELKQSKKHILFIDDMQTVLKSSTKDKDTDISSMMGNILSEGNVRVIGTINFKDYRNSIENNTSIARKLQKIIVEPTSVEESIKILEKNKTYYEEHHKVNYSEDVIKLCVKLSDRYITERSLPDSAFDVLDLSGANTCLVRRENDDIIEHRKKLEQLQNEKNDALNSGNFEFLDSIEEQENFHKKEIANIKRTIEESETNKYIEITEENILSTISEITNIPVDKLQINDKEKLANIDNVLKSEIIGQDEAIETVCKIIKRNKVGLGNKSKSLANLLLVGNSGVGKTILAKKIAEKIFGSENDLIRIDMSEYSEKSSISKLTGAAPSYIGYENGGQLTEAIKHKQHCVLLLDEIEKAHQEVYNIFLQIFDEGRLTDSSGQLVNFKNVLILMTSNVGTKQASEMGSGIGFTTNKENHEKQVIEKHIKKTFTPEFINRLDKVVYFNPLTDEDLKKIVVLELNKFINRLNEIGFNFKYDDNVINYLHGLAIKEKEYGARPILRIIQHHVEDNITELIIKNNYEKNYIFNANIENNILTII